MLFIDSVSSNRRWESVHYSTRKIQNRCVLRFSLTRCLFGEPQRITHKTCRQKLESMDLNFAADSVGLLSFKFLRGSGKNFNVIYLAVVASQICEITWNSEKNRTYSSSKSPKVINLGANQKRICSFLLVINSRPNFGRVSYRFRDIYG